MKYFKLIKDNVFIGVANSMQLLRYQTKHRINLWCDIDEAQYIMCNDSIYRAEWMCPESSDTRGKYETVDVIEISEDEYKSLLETESFEIEMPAPEEIQEEIPIVDYVEAATLDYLIDSKLKQMKTACSNAITNGFDLEVAEGENLHFSLTTQDQLNIITLVNLAASDSSQSYPYHADGQLCRMFSAAEIELIFKSMQMTIARNTTYYNSLKAYIADCKDRDTVQAIYWGCDVPEQYQSEVYKQLFT